MLLAVYVRLLTKYDKHQCQKQLKSWVMVNLLVV